MAYPTAPQVLSGVVFGAANELTGTYVPPTASNVKAGVTFGVNQTGTLEAADYSDLVQERRNVNSVIGSLQTTNNEGPVQIKIFDSSRTSYSRPVAQSSAYNGRWNNLVTLQNGKTYTVAYYHNGKFLRNDTITL